MSYSSIFQVYIWLTLLRVICFWDVFSFCKSPKWFHLFGHSWFVKECMFSIRIQCKISTKFLKLWKTTSLFIYLFIYHCYIYFEATDWLCYGHVNYAPSLLCAGLAWAKFFCSWFQILPMVTKKLYLLSSKYHRPILFIYLFLGGNPSATMLYSLIDKKNNGYILKHQMFHLKKKRKVNKTKQKTDVFFIYFCFWLFRECHLIQLKIGMCSER